MQNRMTMTRTNASVLSTNKVIRNTYMLCKRSANYVFPQSV